MSDVIETPLPPSVRNHWWWRPGWAEGRHFYACHMTLDDQPQLRELVADYQQALAAMPGIDLIPSRWLHLTMQGIRFVDEISRSELVALDDALTAELAAIEPPTVEFRYLTIHPEAVYLKAHPAGALYPLRSKMHDAVASVLGPTRFAEPAPDEATFLPHVSIGYINQDEVTEPIATALQCLTTRPVKVKFVKADLLEYHRDRRMYEWTSTAPVPIGRVTVSEPMPKPN
jgi:2'-5' RNA ligase